MTTDEVVASTAAGEVVVPSTEEEAIVATAGEVTAVVAAVVATTAEEAATEALPLPGPASVVTAAAVDATVPLAAGAPELEVELVDVDGGASMR